MPLFHAYVMMDWSGSDRPRSGKQDCIWIAHESAEASEPITVSPASRTEAEQIIHAVLQSVVTANKGCVLLCADFGYGYPAGFASLVSHTRSAELPPWRVVWRYLREHIRDDIGTKPGQQPNNRSNRFEVANEINAGSSSSASRGPFWCLFKPGNHVCVPQNKPSQPFVFRNTSIASLRITDKRAKSDTPFRLFGTGSVGSQVLTGIPRLESLRFDPRFARCSALWPFETGWAPSSGTWLEPEIRILHAEIYPSVRAPLADTIKDRGQVRAMWHWARDLDATNSLIKEFEIPYGIASGSAEDRIIRNEEGWILGC
jgi:precorrin-8X/cobalt-precorrin-8 methylmutase